MEKVRTDIPGFDRLLKGGLPKGSVTLLSGTPATGKTIFALQYLYNGALHGEAGLFVTFEEKAADILEQAAQFGWDLELLQKKKSLLVVYVPSEEINHKTVNMIMHLAKANGIKRLVIDSVNMLALNIPDVASEYRNISRHSIKRFICRFVSSLKGLSDVTTLLISQTPGEALLSSDEVSEFLCDGIIHISYENMGGKYSRSLLVRKMRRVQNDEDIHPFEIGRRGIVIHTIR